MQSRNIHRGAGESSCKPYPHNHPLHHEGYDLAVVSKSDIACRGRDLSRDLLMLGRVNSCMCLQSTQD